VENGESIRRLDGEIARLLLASTPDDRVPVTALVDNLS